MHNHPKKSLGQHWLRDESILQAIVEAGDVQPEDTVLEIGPGLGTLTRVLAAKAKQVIAVEFDQSLIERLEADVQASNVTIELGDIRTYNFSTLPADFKVIANIPYYLTSHLIRVLSESDKQASKVALLIQKEVAERVAARPGQMSLLSATTQLFWNTELDIAVPAAFFDPPPKVDSQVLVLTRPDTPKYKDYAPILTVMKAGFCAPRKKLINNLSSSLRLDKHLVEDALIKSQIATTVRAQNLTVDNWSELAKHL